MVDYVKNSTGETYQMFNIGRNKITNTRDVKWTNKLYGESTGTDKVQSDYHTASEEDLESEDEEPKDQLENSSDSEQKRPRRSNRI